MDKTYLKDSKDMIYAELSENQTNKLKELEKNFNNEFKCDYYLMVMKNNTIKSWPMSGFYFHYEKQNVKNYQ